MRKEIVSSGNLLLLIGSIIMIHAAYSLLECKDNSNLSYDLDRKYSHITAAAASYDSIKIPLDINIEAFIGYFIAIIGVV